MSEQLDRLRTLLGGRTPPGQERGVLALLGEATPEELNALLEGIEVDELFAAIDDRLWGPSHHRELVELLAYQRRADLSLPNQAAVVHALQVGATDRTDEEAIRDILLAAHGRDLTRLKDELGLFADHRDLEALVYSDVDDLGIREAILDHIASEAVGLDIGEVKILSDIDDTVKSAIHEKRVARGEIYPGVTAFYQALNVGLEDEPFSYGDLTFVTARPGDALGLIESSSKASLQRAGISNLSVMTGSLFALHSRDAMADRKMENIAHYRALFPEYGLVFIGDSGQGDVIVGRTMRETYPEAVRGIFIHDVVDTSTGERELHAAEGIEFFDTYPAAARAARQLDLVSPAGLDLVVTEARAGVDATRFSSPGAEQEWRRFLAADIA